MTRWSLSTAAHNPYSVEVLRDSLNVVSRATLGADLRASNDKDISGMLKALLPISAHVVVTPLLSSAGLDTLYVGRSMCGLRTWS
jgi:folylpolyglutamate synthase/dihydropteroate synthase